MRLGILRQRTLRSANIVAALLGAWSAAELLVIPLYLQLVLHYSPLLVGFAIAPQGVIGFLGASRGAQLVRRIGVMPFLGLSAVSAAAGLSLLGLLLSARSYSLLLAGFVLAGYGTASAAVGATVAATQGIAASEQGLAGGLANMSRQVGAALGVAITAAIIGGGMTPGVAVNPDRSAVLVAAAAALVATVIVLRAVATSATDRRDLVRSTHLATLRPYRAVMCRARTIASNAVRPWASPEGAVSKRPRLPMRLSR